MVSLYDQEEANRRNSTFLLVVVMLVNPLKKTGGGSALFSTHPPIVDRINRLRQLTGDRPRGQSEMRSLAGLQ